MLRFFRDKSFSRLNLVMRCPVFFIHLGSTDSDISANFMKSLKIWNSGNFSKIQETIGWNWDNHSTRLLHFYLLNSIVDKKTKLHKNDFYSLHFALFSIRYLYQRSQAVKSLQNTKTPIIYQIFISGCSWSKSEKLETSEIRKNILDVKKYAQNLAKEFGSGVGTGIPVPVPNFWDRDRFFRILGLGLGSIFQNFGIGIGQEIPRIPRNPKGRYRNFK